MDPLFLTGKCNKHLEDRSGLKKCIEVAQHAWSLNSSGSRANRLKCKLINVKKKKKIRLWNRTFFGKVECGTPGTSVYSRLHQNNGGYLSLEEG